MYSWALCLSTVYIRTASMHNGANYICARVCNIVLLFTHTLGGCSLVLVSPDLVHPQNKKTVTQLYSELPSILPDGVPPMSQSLPVGRGRTLPLGIKTYIMGILNVTPDSFSDGGKYIDSVTVSTSE